LELKGKKIIVTGGASGIGKTLVDKLLNREAIVGVFDVAKENLLRLAQGYPGIYCRDCDICNVNDVLASVNDFFGKFGEINILINNAGIVYNELLISFSKEGLIMHNIEMWNKVISTNLSSVFYVTSHVVQKMIMQRTKGVIINVSSIASVGNIGQSAYSAAKAGINALTTTWAKELGAVGIRVAGIAPGFAKTETTLKSMSEHMINEWIKKTPVRRMATPEEIVEGILFIITNDFFSGRTLEIDGGLRI
jgi:3-oxoacyl-[acyl-carrier protein] reductase